MANLRENAPLIRKTKAEVSYRNFQACRNCNYFYASGACELVEGPISADGVCDIWEQLERPSVYKDRDFFQREYERKK